MTSPEPYTPEVSGFYGPGPIWAWRIAVLSTTITTIIRMQLRKRVDINILMAEAVTIISYPLIASFDLILKVSREPYDWEAIRSIPTSNIYMVAGPILYPSLGDPKWSLSARSQAANVLLPLNIIDSFLPFPFLACITLLSSDSILLPRSTKRNLAWLLGVSFTWCLLVDMSMAAKIIGSHPDAGPYSGILTSMGSFMFMGGRLVWASHFHLMPMSSLLPMLIIPMLFGPVSDTLSFLWALVRWDDSMSRALERLVFRFFSDLFIATQVIIFWTAILLILLPSAWIPEFPDFGLMLGDLDQAAALGVAVVLALYSLCDTLGWKQRKRNAQYLHINNVERNGDRDIVSDSWGDGDSSGMYPLERSNDIRYRD